MNKKTVLIVDDSDFDRNLLSKALSLKGGFESRTASGGEECLELLRHQHVDLVLLDIMMPGLSGDQVLDKIRQKWSPVELPVVMASAKADASDVIDCIKRGANDYITKPINFEVAVSRISMHLGLAKMSKEMAQMKEMLALDAVISTYHHQINSLLANALNGVETLDLGVPANREKISEALWGIADKLKAIAAISEKKVIPFEEGDGPVKMIRLSGDAF